MVIEIKWWYPKEIFRAIAAGVVFLWAKTAKCSLKLSTRSVTVLNANIQEEIIKSNKPNDA